MVRAGWGRFPPLGPFGRNVMTLAGGTVVAQAVMAVFLPVLARLYSAEEFGICAVFTSVGTIAAVIASGRYDLSIPIPASDSEAWALFRLATWLAAGFALGSGLLLWLWIPALLAPLGSLAHLLPLYIACTAYSTAAGYWLGREGDFSWVSLSRIIQAVAILGLQVVWSCLGYSGGLVIGLVSGAALLSLLNLARIRWGRSGVHSRFSLTQAARGHYRSPCFLLPAHAVNTLGAQLPVVFMNSFFGAAMAGFFGLALRLVGLPLQVISQSVNQVFFPHASREYAARGECAALFTRLVKRLFCIGAVGLGLALLCGPLLVEVVMGEQWRTAGRIIQILAPFLLIRFVSSAVGSMSMIAGRQDVDLKWQVFMLVLVLAGLSVGAVFDDWRLSVVGYGIGSAVAFSAALVICYRFARYGSGRSCADERPAAARPAEQENGDVVASEANRKAGASGTDAAGNAKCPAPAVVPFPPPPHVAVVDRRPAAVPERHRRHHGLGTPEARP